MPVHLVAPWSVARALDRGVNSGRCIPLRGRTFAISEGTASPFAVAEEPALLKPPAPNPHRLQAAHHLL